MICRTEFVICRTDFEDLSDRFVGQKTNSVGQIEFVGQMDFRILRFLNFVGQICRTDNKFCSTFWICRTDFVATNLLGGGGNR